MNGPNDFLFRRAAKEALEEGKITPEQFDRLIDRLDLRQADVNKKTEEQINKAKARLMKVHAFA